MKKIISKFCIFMCVSIIFVSCSGQVPVQNRTITVVGTSSVYITPDTVSISFAAVSQDINLQIAKQKNDTILQKVKALFEKYKIEQKNISLGQLTIHPRYSYSGNEPRFLGYEVNQGILLRLDKLEDYEPFVTALLATGVNRIYDTNYSVSEVRKYTDEARAAAVKAAYEKAETLCSAAELNGKPLRVGKVLSITEGAQYDTGMYVAKNSAAFALHEEVGSLPAGQIELSAQVHIVFELE